MITLRQFITDLTTVYYQNIEYNNSTSSWSSCRCQDSLWRGVRDRQAVRPVSLLGTPTVAGVFWRESKNSCLSVCLLSCLSLSPCPSLSLSPPVSLSACLPVSLSHPLFLSVCLSLSLTCLSVHLPLPVVMFIVVVYCCRCPL